MICDECETVAHCMKNGCVPKTTKKNEAMKLALEAYMAAGFGNSTDFALQRKAYDLALQALAESALERMAENARELGLDYEPDWKEEYLKAVDLHCITLDELREAEAWIKNLEKLMADQDVILDRQTARIVDLQTHINNLEGEE